MHWLVERLVFKLQAQSHDWLRGLRSEVSSLSTFTDFDVPLNVYASARFNSYGCLESESVALAYSGSMLSLLCQFTTRLQRYVRKPLGSNSK